MFSIIQAVSGVYIYIWNESDGFLAVALIPAAMPDLHLFRGWV